MYRMLGEPFAMGRGFLPEEGVAGKDHVVILTHKLWVRLGADPRILGKTLTLDQKPYTIVGVFGSGQPDRLGWDVVVPLVFTPDQINHDFHWLVTMGRLKDGVTLEQANAQEGVSRKKSIAKDYPSQTRVGASKLNRCRTTFSGDNFKKTLWLLLGAVGFLLLIACVNIANLLLAKGTTRQKEIAIRSAIGASRRDVFGTVADGEPAVGHCSAASWAWALAMPCCRVYCIDAARHIAQRGRCAAERSRVAGDAGGDDDRGLAVRIAPAWYASRVDPAGGVEGRRPLGHQPLSQ